MKKIRNIQHMRLVRNPIDSYKVLIGLSQYTHKLLLRNSLLYMFCLYTTLNHSKALNIWAVTYAISWSFHALLLCVLGDSYTSRLFFCSFDYYNNILVLRLLHFFFLKNIFIKLAFVYILK